ncbi:hypothetical protein ACVWW4_004236 [Bradyrhizobium sp. LB7.1]
MLQPVAKHANLHLLFYEVCRSEFRRLAEPNNARNVLGASAAMPLLCAAEDQRSELDVLAHIQRADPLRTMELMAGERQHVDVRSLQVNRNPPDRLDRIGVKERAD